MASEHNLEPKKRKSEDFQLHDMRMNCSYTYSQHSFPLSSLHSHWHLATPLRSRNSPKTLHQGVGWVSLGSFYMFNDRWLQKRMLSRCLSKTWWVDDDNNKCTTKAAANTFYSSNSSTSTNRTHRNKPGIYFPRWMVSLETLSLASSSVITFLSVPLVPSRESIYFNYKNKYMQHHWHVLERFLTPLTPRLFAIIIVVVVYGGSIVVTHISEYSTFLLLYYCCWC